MSRLVIDAQPVCFRAYHVEAAEWRRAGGTDEPPHAAVLARLALMATKLIGDFRPSEGAVVFEGKGDTWRHEKMPTYKSNRPEKPPGLKRLILEARELFEMLGFACLAIDGQEADDVIASLVWRHDGVTVVSSDKDFYQFLGVRGAKIWDPLKLPHDAPPDAWPGRFVDARDLFEKFGVERPQQVIEVQALAGDAVDGVPGCPGIGMLTAKRLVSAFGTVDRLFAELESQGETCLAPLRLTRYGKQLKAGVWDVLLSRELVTLRTDLLVNLEPIRGASPARLTEWSLRHWLAGLGDKTKEATR